MQHQHHIGADLVGTIEKEYIRKQYKYKAGSSDADGRLLYYKSFNRVWQGSKIGK